MSERMPKTEATATGFSPRFWKHCRSAEIGLVPISPKTTPRAPRVKDVV